MLEIELKFWPVNRRSILTVLANSGELHFSTILRSLYFDHPLRQPDTLFRLRSFCGETYLTAKSPRHKDDLTIRDEYETLVFSENSAIGMLKCAGFELRGGVEERWREQWSMPDGTVVVIERLSHPDIPDYVEIEGADTDAIFSCAKLLGLSETRNAPITFDQLASLYGVSFADLQHPLENSLIGDRVESPQRNRQFHVEGAIRSKTQVSYNGGIVIHVHEKCGRVLYDDKGMDVEKPLELCSFFKLAGLTVTKGSEKR